MTLETTSKVNEDLDDTAKTLVDYKRAEDTFDPVSDDAINKYIMIPIKKTESKPTEENSRIDTSRSRSPVSRRRRSPTPPSRRKGPLGRRSSGERRRSSRERRRRSTSRESRTRHSLD